MAKQRGLLTLTHARTPWFGLMVVALLLAPLLGFAIWAVISTYGEIPARESVFWVLALVFLPLDIFLDRWASQAKWDADLPDWLTAERRGAFTTNFALALVFSPAFSDESDPVFAVLATSLWATPCVFVVICAVDLTRWRIWG